jgi:hypothetical protein
MSSANPHSCRQSTGSGAINELEPLESQLKALEAEAAEAVPVGNLIGWQLTPNRAILPTDEGHC